MRVLIAGATGVLGRELIRQLVPRGHRVLGMTRSVGHASALRDAGAECIVADVLDAAATKAAVVQAQPDVIVQQLTQLPHDKFLPRKIDYTGTNRVRIEGTRNLLAGAAEVGPVRLVGQSISFLVAPQGPMVLDESAAVLSEGPAKFVDAAQSAAETEKITTDAGGVSLRYGFFYGPGTWYAKNGHFAAEARKRRLPVVSKGEGVFSFIHLIDAAAATVAAIESDVSGVYNITDDDPAAMYDWVPAYCAAVGAKKPMRVPMWAAKLAAGKVVASQAMTSRGASNAKAHRDLPDWKLRYPSWREGFANGL